MPDQGKVLLQLRQLASSHIQEYLRHQINISLQQIRHSQQKGTCAATLLVFAPAQLPPTSAIRMEGGPVQQSGKDFIDIVLDHHRDAALGLQPSLAAGQQQLPGHPSELRLQHCRTWSHQAEFA